MTTRPLTEESLGTCDWGHCDDESVAERLSPHDGEWLAVCTKHQGTTPRPSPGRATCHHCDTDYALKVDGTLRHHNRGFAERCPGSGQKPESKETT